ncbi:hypothetical protein PY479_05240 [Shewanella sp. A32]|uniref:hypothetical protein n=1 Tax=Shewanella sp. A32 TaxID=3031327 RepID=UPI0023B88999|nr:hypothetical protein [Shewanella sp. A32]MDF0533684.1 hypothetical protein [Shewanella sp. A32]
MSAQPRYLMSLAKLAEQQIYHGGNDITIFAQETVKNAAQQMRKPQKPHRKISISLMYHSVLTTPSYR